MTQPRAGFKLFLGGSHEHNEALRLAVSRHLQDAFGNDYELTVVELKSQPGIGAAEQILATPTLLRTFPGPQRRVVGDLHSKYLLTQALLFDIT